MDSSFFDAIAPIVTGIEGPIGVISLLVILFSFITWAFFSREGTWFRVFAILLLFLGCGGVAYAVLQPTPEPTSPPVSTPDPRPEPVPNSNPEPVEEPRELGSEDSNIEAGTDPKDAEDLCGYSAYRRYGSACMYFTPPNFASVRMGGDGTLFYIQAKGPRQLAGYVSDNCPDEPPGTVGCVMMDSPSAGHSTPVYSVAVGTKIYGNGPDATPSANQTAEITFPNCDETLKLRLGSVNVSAQAEAWSYAGSAVKLGQELPTVYERVIMACGTSGDIVVRFFTQAGSWREMTFSRFDFFRGLQELRSIYSEF